MTTLEALLLSDSLTGRISNRETRVSKKVYAKRKVKKQKQQEKLAARS